jgi:tetratricopeptide (TPR) repeat protein
MPHHNNVKSRSALPLVSLAVTFLLPTCLPAAEQSNQFPDLPQLSSSSFPEGVRGAVERAYNAVKANPKSPLLNGQLGIILLANHGADDVSEICFRRAHFLDQTSFRWSYLLGAVLARAGKFQDASGTFRDALRINPKYLPARLNLGECLLATGNWKEASELFEALVMEDPRNPHANYGLARVRAARNDLNGAAESFRRACELYPNFGAAHYGLARTYERLGDKERSEQELSLYAASKGLGPPLDDPLMTEVQVTTAIPSEIRQAEELAGQGNWPAAARAYEETLAKNPGLEKAHVKLISIYGRLGQFEAAEQHFRAAVLLDPNDPESYLNHGLLLASQEKYSEAELAFRKVLEINPRFPEGRVHLGHMLEAQGKLAESVAEYEKAVADVSDDAEAHFALGRIAVNQDRTAEGIQHFLISLRTGSDDNRPRYLYALGAAYARAGDRENALKYLRRAHEGAAARGQSNLVQAIDADLKQLEAEPGPE